jgi:outer membrane protein assembly factor BamB
MALIALLIGVGAQRAMARSWRPRTDLEFIAIRIADGKIFWSHKPASMGDAHSEIFKDTVALFLGNVLTRDTFIILDKSSGGPAAENVIPKEAPLARADNYYMRFPFITKSGFELKPFIEGHTRDLVFTLPWGANSSTVIRQNRKDRWPHNVCLAEDVVMFDHGMYADEAVIYAYDVTVPGQPAWTLDLNRHIAGSTTPEFDGLDTHVEGRKTRMHKAVLDGRLYVNAEEHLFCIDPVNGTILWQRNMAKDLGLKFSPDFFGGAINIAFMAKEGTVLIVSFENRVIAYDEKMRKYLWHLMPDSFPHTPLPAVHDGVVYLNAGSQRVLQVVP